VSPDGEAVDGGRVPNADLDTARHLVRAGLLGYQVSGDWVHLHGTEHGQRMYDAANGGGS
jgi:hypothetical protein